MKVLKIGAITLLVYVGIVVAFESLIGFFQPTAGSTLVRPGGSWKRPSASGSMWSATSLA